MEYVNKTAVTEFILLAFSNFHQFQILLFVIILLMFVISLCGNLAIIVSVKIGTSLHTPMYFFIGVFAALEITFVYVTVPKLLANLIIGSKIISFIGCFVQLYTFNALGVTECYLFAVMAFDRDLAINNPLRYGAVMTHIFCIKLAFLPWIISFVIALIPTVLTSDLDFCGPNTVNHFFCDLAPIQSLSCSDPFISNMTTSIAAVFASLIPFVLIIGFYSHIIITISSIKNVEGKKKAFSTCSSHLIVASMFYGSVVVVYLKPQGTHYDKFLALIYTVLIPALNPFIYSLRNKGVKEALMRLRSTRVFQ